MHERFSTQCNFLHEFPLALVIGFTERRLAAHLGAFLLDEKREVQNTHSICSETRWHSGLAIFCGAIVCHGPTRVSS
jgi:hypothetical protein